MISGITDDLEQVQTEIAVNKREESIARNELEQILQQKLDDARVQLSKQQKNETTEIAKHFFKMEKDRKAMQEAINESQEAISNVRGKVEISKDQTDKIATHVTRVDEVLLKNRDAIAKLESKIDQVRAALQAQQTNALDGQALADQLVTDKAQLEIELENAKEKEAEILREREKISKSVATIENELNFTRGELEKVKNSNFDRQKLKELIAEETAELHDILDETCGKVSQLETDRNEDNNNIIKQAEKANSHAELLLEREETTKIQMEAQMSKVKKQLEVFRDDTADEFAALKEKGREGDRELQDIKFQLERRLKDLETSMKEQLILYKPYTCIIDSCGT